MLLKEHGVDVKLRTDRIEPIRRRMACQNNQADRFLFDVCMVVPAIERSRDTKSFYFQIVTLRTGITPGEDTVVL